MPLDMGKRPSAVERYAIKFDIDAPAEEPTDANIRKVLSGCMRPVPFKLYGPVRQAVKEYRASTERAERIARDQGEPGVPAPGEPGYSYAGGNGARA